MTLKSVGCTINLMTFCACRYTVIAGGIFPLGYHFLLVCTVRNGHQQYNINMVWGYFLFYRRVVLFL